MGQTILVEDPQGAPLPFASIQITMGEASPVGIFTDSSGIASILRMDKSEPGDFRIKVSYVGFETWEDNLLGKGPWTVTMIPEATLLDQVVITAQYAPGTAEQSLFKVKVINRQKMEAMGAVSLVDVLRNEVNIRVSQDNVLGSSISLQGLGGQNVKILIDGVPVIGRQDGNIDLSQINLNNIARIELVEGPLAVNFGTDALAGAINLITKSSGRDGIELSANSYYETAGQYNVDGSLNWTRKKHRISMSGGRNYFDGWAPADPFFQFPQKRSADTLRAKPWNPKEQHFARMEYDVELGKLSLRPYVETFRETITNRGAPRLPYFETAFDDYYYTLRNNAGIQLRGNVAEGKHLRIVGAYNHFRRIKNTYFKDLTTLEEELTSNASDQDTSRFKVWMSLGSFSTSNSESRFNYELGYDVNFEEAIGQRIKGLEKEQLDLAIFSSTQIQVLKHIKVRPGLRFTYNTAYQAPLIPSLNIKYAHPKRREQRNSFTVRGSYARGFRAPSLKELYFEFVDVNHNILGNPALQAEYSNNYQIGVDWKNRKEKHLLKVETGVYFNRIKNLIALAQSPTRPEFTYINIGRFQSLGLQGDLSWRHKHVNLSLGGAYVGRYNSLAEKAAIPEFNFSPEVRGSIQWTIPKFQGTVAMFYKFNGSLNGFSLLDGQVSETRIDAYSMLDLNFTKDFWQKRIQWTVGARNLMDVQNINASSGSGGTHSASTGSQPVSWGRTLFTTLRFNFNWKP